MIGLVVCGVACVAWIISQGRGPGEVETGPPGWRVAEGSLTQDRAGRWRAKGDATLVRGGVELRLAPGTSLEFGSEGDLSALESGTATLTAAQSFSIGEWSFEPLLDASVGNEPGAHDSEAARLQVTPIGFEVVGGRLRAKGRALLDGRVLDPASPFFRFDRGIPISGDAEPDPVDPRGSPPARPTGQIVDAASGLPVSEAVVHLVFSPHEEGYPAFPADAAHASVRADANGYFAAPVFRAADPRLYLHLEVDHPDFEPFVQVLGPGADVFGNWPLVTLRLRRALTTTLRFVDEVGHAVGRLAVELVGSPADQFVGEDSWDEGRTLRADRALVRYTREDGSLRITKDSQLLYVRDPVAYLWDDDVAEPTRYVLVEARAEEARGVSPEKWAILHIRYATGLSDVLLDGDGVPVSDSLVQLEAAGMRPVRVVTDDQGRYRFVPRPYPRRSLPESVRWPRPWPVRFDRPCTEGDDLCALNPRSGDLTVLSPILWKQALHSTFDRQSRERILAARPAGLLRFDLVAEDETGVLYPVPADSVVIDDGALTLIERSVDGGVVFAGALPTSAGQRVVSVNGFEPVLLQIPARLPRDRYLDLGQVLLERGESIRVRLHGGFSELYARTNFHIAPVDAPALAQELRFDSSGELLVSGLTRGVEVAFGVDGSGIEPYAGRLRIDTEVAQRGLDIALVLRTEVPVVSRGGVTDLAPEQTPGYRVVERYYGLDDRPVSCVSYPLRPDAGFGSIRILPEPRQAEVFVLGPYFQVARAFRNPTTRLEFAFGLLEMKPSRYAVLSFCGRSAERVLETLALHSNHNDYHDVARAFAVDRSSVASYLVIDNLMPGRYRLDWRDPDESTATFVFEVEERDEVLDLTVPCPDPSLDLRVVFVSDPEGRAIPGVVFAGTVTADPVVPFDLGPLPYGVALDLFPVLPADSGQGDAYVLAVKRGEPLDVRVTAPGFLGQRWLVPVGRELPVQFELERGVRVEGTVEDPNGQPFTGTLLARWSRTLSGPSSDPPIVVTHVDPPAQIVASKGGIRESRLPALAHSFEFQDARSEARDAVEQQFLGARPGELKLKLRESRAVRGTVLLFDGTPAANAVVALIESGQAHRFPQFEPRLEKARYSAKADALGRFEIDGVPVDLRESLALLAHLPGYTDAVEDPFDRRRNEHRLILAEPTELILDVGYGSDEVQDDYLFELYHSHDLSGRGPLLRIGEVLPTRVGGKSYVGVLPGYYRVTWSHRAAPGDAIQTHRVVDAVVEPGRVSSLRLRIREPFRDGEVLFNGRPLGAGWVLLTDDPADSESTRLSRVVDGRFRGPLPTRGSRLYAAVVPDDRATPFPNQRRGEALFREVDGGRLSRASGRLLIEYVAFDLTLLFPPAAFARLSPTLTLEIPNHEWVGQGYRSSFVGERVSANPTTIRLLAPGTYTFKTSTSAASRVVHEVEIDRDLQVEVSL